MAKLYDPLLESVYMTRFESFRWKNGLTFILFNANDNVAPTPVASVVGKSTHRVEDIFRIPILLKLYPLTLNGVCSQQSIYTDG